MLIFLLVSGLCGHHKSIMYFSDTLNPKYSKLYPSQRCQSHSDYNNGRCGDGPKNYMGLHADPRYPGEYYISAASVIQYNGKNQYRYILKRITKQTAEFLGLNLLNNFLHDNFNRE